MGDDGVLRFHLAVAVGDLDAACAFYGGLLGCRQARRHDHSVTFDFFGHQLVCHLAPDQVPAAAPAPAAGDDAVPARHFGAIFPWPEWERRIAGLRAAGVRFLVEPHVADHGPGGEQATCFFADPSGNVLEFKTLREPERLFAT